MKTIGFVDDYISEWHANNYPGWFREICEQTGEAFQVRYAWAEREISPVDGRSTEEWCRAFGVEKCETLQELCEKADYILVLAPSNPEKHLRYAQEVLKYRKHTYIDKTFAPDYQTAKQIFDLAERCGTKIFSSSALRYGTELDEMIGARAVITQGGGSNLDEYVIHQIEMAVKVIGEKAERVRVEKQGENQYIISVAFANGKRATMVYSGPLGFSVCAEKDGRSDSKAIVSKMFLYLLKDILRFYRTGEASFDVGQTLEVMKIREAVIKGKAQPGVWLEL